MAQRLDLVDGRVERTVCQPWLAWVSHGTQKWDGKLDWSHLQLLHLVCVWRMHVVRRDQSDYSVAVASGSLAPTLWIVITHWWHYVLSR